jgi:hypothetical protein
VDFVQAAWGSSYDRLNYNSVVFDSGANTEWTANAMRNDKRIEKIEGLTKLFYDAPNDLVPQIVGLHAISDGEPWNIIRALFSAPCLFPTFCSVYESPHTLPYVPPAGE